MQTGSQPRVRSACEGCHERKQRCVIPDDGGPCLACQQSSRYCFFIPRSKAGRPRRPKSGDSASTLGQQHVAESLILAHFPEQSKGDPSNSLSFVADGAYGGDGESTSGFDNAVLEMSDCFSSPLSHIAIDSHNLSGSSLLAPHYSSGLLDSMNDDGPGKSPPEPASILLDKLTELSHYRQELHNGSFDGLLTLQLVVTSFSILSAEGLAVTQAAAQATGKPDLPLLGLAHSAMLQGVDVATEVLGAAETQTSAHMATCTSPTMGTTLHGGSWTGSSSSPNSSTDGSSRFSEDQNPPDLNTVLTLHQLGVALTQAHMCLTQLSGFREAFVIATPRVFSNLHGRVSKLIRTVSRSQLG